MMISRQDISNYINLHFMSMIMGGYMLNLDGGYVIRFNRYSCGYIFEMGEYIQGDMVYMIDHVLCEKFFNFLRKMDMVYRGGYLIYGYGEDIYLCLDVDGEGMIYERVKRLFMDGDNDDGGIERVSYNCKVYYKYLIKDIDGFLGVLELLGI